MALLLKHQTPEQFLARLRAEYREAVGDRLLVLTRYVINSVAVGDFTDAQYRAAFSRSTSQWTSLKGRMNALINASNMLNTAIGE